MAVSAAAYGSVSGRPVSVDRRLRRSSCVRGASCREPVRQPRGDGSMPELFVSRAQSTRPLLPRRGRSFTWPADPARGRLTTPTYSDRPTCHTEWMSQLRRAAARSAGDCCRGRAGPVPEGAGAGPEGVEGLVRGHARCDEFVAGVGGTALFLVPAVSQPADRIGQEAPAQVGHDRIGAGTTETGSSPRCSAVRARIGSVASGRWRMSPSTGTAYGRHWKAGQI
jgi:hypothetical protein